MDFKEEMNRRRTFAIVSHPDAGKTTLTEKFLLYGGAVQMAGSVSARKKERATVSDWLEIERKRGISVSSTVLYFDYHGYRINLLDTPGHNDFSEDTYRVLMAVDSVIMVIDGGKGIEQQTKKLFEVCSRRNIPVFTFVNKMDRPALDTLAILDEIENVLGIHAYPINWPLGCGNDFKGVWDRRTKKAYLYERTVGGAYRAPVSTYGLDDPAVKSVLSESTYTIVAEELEMLEQAGTEFNVDHIINGFTTPVFFGSAINNFGVQLLLDGFVEYSPSPQPRMVDTVPVLPDSNIFSGFVFKIQANMDPKHRDRMAFIRIVSGKFSRDMQAVHIQTGRRVRLSNSSNVFGRERVSVDEAYPGDVIGITGGNYLAIGDTLSENESLKYNEIPRFPPECFITIINPIPSNYKKFSSGIDQLVQEGLVHLFTIADTSRKTIVLGAVGPLQFDLVKYRLESEYGAQCRIEPVVWKYVMWITSECENSEELSYPLHTSPGYDRYGKGVVLFEEQWHKKFFFENNPNVLLSETPP